jgi:hypothetical protein
VPADSRAHRLLAFLLVYVAASLLHHVHNAEFLHEYPNLPATLTRGEVYAAWLGEAAVGLIGYVLLRNGWTRAGPLLIGLSALAGFGGLAHYYAAPVAAHTLAMNATILLEVATASLLLAAVIRRMASSSTFV